MAVVITQPTEHVAWRCVAGPDAWIGTSVTVDLTHSEGETVLLFTHAGWLEGGGFMAHCSTQWAVYLLGLKASLEGGKATPWLDKEKISRWG